VPLFLLLFAATYFLMAQANINNFNSRATRGSSGGWSAGDMPDGGDGVALGVLPGIATTRRCPCGSCWDWPSRPA
jgi:hypothetical protein